ncbi:unnamed protein product [Closterium sp. Yama58-4]|nr:unnamed protein product [Closterium sp. Yama58-4]
MHTCHLNSLFDISAMFSPKLNPTTTLLSNPLLSLLSRRTLFPNLLHRFGNFRVFRRAFVSPEDVWREFERMARGGASSDPKGYYAALGLAGKGRQASQQEIKSAFRQLAMETHPDRQPDEGKRRAAEERFKRIAEAYEVLRDPSKRSAYDSDEGKKRAAEERFERIAEAYEVLRDPSNDGGALKWEKAGGGGGAVQEDSRIQASAMLMTAVRCEQHADEGREEEGGRGVAQMGLWRHMRCFSDGSALRDVSRVVSRELRAELFLQK